MSRRAVLSLVAFVSLSVAVFLSATRPAAAAVYDQLDQQVSGDTYGGASVDEGSPDAQTFTPSITGPIRRIDMQLNGSNDQITLQLRNVESGGKPTGSVLAQATLVVNSGTAFYTFNLNATPTLTAGTKYAIVLSTTGFNRPWYTLYDNPYSRGEHWSIGISGDWEARPQDLGFRTYVAIDDSTAPDTAIGTKPDAFTNATSASFTFSGTDNLTQPGQLTFECASGSGSFSLYLPCTSPQMFSSLAEGSHRFRVRATDLAGLTDATPAEHTWIVDTTAPSTTLTTTPTAPNAAGWFNTGLTVTLTATDQTDLSGVAETYYRINSGANQMYTGPFALPMDGVYTVAYWSTDNAGNTETAQTTTIRIDQAAPITTAATQPTAPNAAGWFNTPVIVTLTATDQMGLSGVDRIQWSFNCGSYQTYSVPLLISINGVHTLDYRAVDIAGNVETAQRLTIRLDQSAPQTTVTTNPPSPSTEGWFNANTSITLNATDQPGLSGVLSTEYRVDGAPYQPYTGPFTLTTEGQHTIIYRSRDLAGNVEAERTFTALIDKTAPEAVLSFDPATRSLEVTGRDALSGPAVNGPVSPATCTTQRTGQTCMYRITDRAGNNATLTVLISTTASRTTAVVQRIQYSGQPAATPLSNEFSFETQSGSSSRQCASVTSPPVLGQPSASRRVCAQFDGMATTLQFLSPVAPSSMAPGLGLLQVATNQGALAIELP